LGFINHILQGPEVLPLVVSHSPPEVSFLLLVYLNKPEIPELVLGTLAAIVTGAILPLMGFLISNMINAFLEPADELRKDSKFWALMFIALGVAGTIYHPIRSYFFDVVGSKLIKRIGLMCYKKIVHMEVGWFDKVGIRSEIYKLRVRYTSKLNGLATTIRSDIYNFFFSKKNCYYFFKKIKIDT